MKHPKQIPDEIKAKLIEYLEYHGSANIKPVRSIWDGDTPIYLVRFTDAQECAMSGLYMEGLGKHGWYITELDACPRENEEYLIRGISGDGDFDNYGDCDA